MAKKTPSDFGQRLRAARKRAGLTQAQLAEAADVHAISIAKLETGARQNPQGDMVSKLAAALGVTPSDLLGTVQSSEASELVDRYLSGDWARVDRPTEEEVAWLRSVPSVVWVGLAPTERTVHELVELHRRR
jgi:transcriptional regulator with XRE-family HTH domain